MPFKHYIRSIEGKTEVIPFYEKPDWFNQSHVKKILGGLSCFSWFTWSATPQGGRYWQKYSNNSYDQLPPEPKEIIDSWVAQVNEETPHVLPAW